MKRKLSLLLAALFLCLCAWGCTPTGRRSSALKIINKDLEGITALAEQILDTGEVPEDLFIEGVERVTFVEPDWVEFCTGIRGSVPETAYCGFYYSKEDRPMSFQGADMELVEDGSGWSWEGEKDGQGGGDNSYYTERILYGWFYYEMYF